MEESQLNLWGPAPSPEEMLAWRDQLNGEWGNTGIDENLDRAQDDEENLYFQRFKVDAPGGKLAVKTGSAPSDADAAVDSIVPRDISVKVIPIRPRKVYKEQAQLLQDFAQGILRNVRRKRDVIRLLASDQVIRRVAVARVLVDPDAWPGKGPDYDELDEEKKERWDARYRRKLPIVWERRSPRYTRWREDLQGNILAVVEHYPTTALEAFEAFKNFPKAVSYLNGRRPNDQIWISDVWVGRHRAAFIESIAIFPGDGVLPHGYQEIPYAIAPFRELAFEAPGDRYRGMLTNARQLYEIESQVLTMHVWMLAWNAWRTWVGWTTNKREIKIVPGEVTMLDRENGEYLEMLRGDAVPDEVLQTAAMVDSYIQRNAVAQGPRTQEGTRSAQQVWAIQSIRQGKVEGAKVSLQSLVSRCLELSAMHLETVVKEQLTLPIPGYDENGESKGQVTIKPSDIDGYWDCFDVEFTRRLDPAVLEQAKALMALSMNNWMPLKQSWELSGLTTNPQQWMDELLEQAVERQPFIAQLHALEQIKEVFGEQSPEALAFFQNMQQQKMQQARGGGGPGEPAGGIMTPASPKGPDAAGGGGARPPSRATGNTNTAPGATRPRGIAAPDTAGM